MELGEVKMIVAQNCAAYYAKYAVAMASMGSISQSCNNCSNFVRGKCTKELFDEIRERITIN